MKTTSKKSAKDTLSIGSALILAVVLTSLLAIIGVMFVMIARVDKMATSAISENKELNFAVETVVAKISQELVLDVPGMPKGSEYYDYPDTNNAWLASLEPYEKTGGNYYWRQISDVTGYIEKIILGVKVSWDTQDIEITNSAPDDLFKAIVEDHKKIELDNNGNLLEQLADADGDGVADSKWVKLDDITSNKGKPIYAAIRIVDNGGMINVNTAYKFDPNGAVKNEIDGSNQAQINLAALRRGTTKPFSNLNDMRKGGETWDLDRYIDDVVWQIERPAGLWTPFDISDELKLRNRYILNYNLMTSRIEGLWTKAFDGGLDVPRTTTSQLTDPNDWFWYTNNSSLDANDYDYRHISTIYNMDRIIDPNGRKMLNINDANVSSVYDKIIDANLNIANAREVAAQIAVNLKDYIDSDSDVTPFAPDVNSPTYYGFERPCVYISEIAHRLRILAEPGPISYTLRRSYAIELYKPYYPEDNYPESNQWRLIVQGYSGSPIPVVWSGTKHFHVICLDDPCAPISPSVNFESGDDDPNFSHSVEIHDINYNTIVTSVSLERLTDAGWISVDSVDVPPWLVTTNEGTRSFKREITPHKCIRRLWSPEANKGEEPSLGRRDAYYHDSSATMIQAHPANSDFNNIGEIGMLFRKSAYEIGSTDTEGTARLNLADPYYQNLFQYLTVFDPNSDTIDNDGDGLIDALDTNTPEYKVPGRININTAPWYVLAQLPWVSQRKGGYNNTALAQAIVAYRDKTSISGGPDYSDRPVSGFRSVGELCNVVRGNTDFGIDYYTRDPNDLTGFPDLTPGGSTGDGAPDDFEERDVIFARISNLVTVRSDVFTAYILVRIGADGPQKRVMAILDRSNVYSGDGKVKIVALHPVPDPR